MNTRYNYFPLMLYGDSAPQCTYFFFFFLAAFFFVAIECLLSFFNLRPISIPASAFLSAKPYHIHDIAGLNLHCQSKNAHAELTCT